MGYLKYLPDKYIFLNGILDLKAGMTFNFNKLVESLVELGYEERAISCKYSEKAAQNDKPLKDITDQYEFVNMRAYLFWCVRDWLNPKNVFKAMLPPNSVFMEEATEILANKGELEELVDLSGMEVVD